MTTDGVVVEREIDLPRAIVWDGLVDSVLVSGWLGEARIDPVVGGRYDLQWVGSPEFPGADGRIVRLDEPDRLVVETIVYGEFDFRLAQVAGGSRGTGTRLTLEISGGLDSTFDRPAKRRWSDILEHLEQLLRGHPVDWARAEDDRARRPRDTDLA